MSSAKYLYLAVPGSVGDGVFGRVEAILLHYEIPADYARFANGRVYRILEDDANKFSFHTTCGQNFTPEAPPIAEAADLANAWEPVHRAYDVEAVP